MADAKPVVDTGALTAVQLKKVDAFGDRPFPPPKRLLLPRRLPKRNQSLFRRNCYQRQVMVKHIEI
jgi:hypothetical protein